MNIRRHIYYYQQIIITKFKFSDKFIETYNILLRTVRISISHHTVLRLNISTTICTAFPLNLSFNTMPLSIPD